LRPQKREARRQNNCFRKWWRYEKNRPWEEELTKHPNFIGTPWIAGAFGSREVLEHMFKSAIENLLKYASGEKPSNVVDRNLYV
jgi:lactate dehydrogenase-like 2-hydroxyacid dehydrogenase